MHPETAPAGRGFGGHSAEEPSVRGEGARGALH